MSTIKNQHYIPQSYLRNFSVKRKDEHYVHVRYLGEKFHEVNIQRICAKNYFYTIPDIEALDRNQIENYYSHKIDSLYPEIQRVVCNDSITVINDDQRRMLINGVINLYFRTPKFLTYCESHINELEKNS